MRLRLKLKRRAVRTVLGAAHYLGINRLLRFKHRRIPMAVMYHGVTDHQRLDMDASRHMWVSEFDAQMAMLKKQFTIVSNKEWVQAVNHPTPGSRRLLTITFDDGYANNLLSAAPVLASHGLTAGFYVCTGRILAGEFSVSDLLELAVLYGPNGSYEFELAGRNVALQLAGRRQRLEEFHRLRHIVGEGGPLHEQAWERLVEFAVELYQRLGRPQPPEEIEQQYRLLTVDQVKRLQSQGMEIGSHCTRHLRLAEASEEGMVSELATAAQQLQDMTGIPPEEQLLAYPLGSYDHRVMRAAKQVGHPAAFAVVSGVRPTPEHLYELPRIGLYRGNGRILASAQISGLLDALRRPRRANS